MMIMNDRANSYSINFFRNTSQRRKHILHKTKLLHKVEEKNNFYYTNLNYKISLTNSRNYLSIRSEFTDLYNSH